MELVNGWDVEGIDAVGRLRKEGPSEGLRVGLWAVTAAGATATTPLLCEDEAPPAASDDARPREEVSAAAGKSRVAPPSPRPPTSVCTPAGAGARDSPVESREEGVGTTAAAPPAALASSSRGRLREAAAVPAVVATIVPFTSEGSDEGATLSPPRVEAAKTGAVEDAAPLALVLPLPSPAWPSSPVRSPPP